MNHIGTIELESKRLLLRRFNIEDAKDMFNNWANDEEVTKYLTWETHKNIEITKEILNSWIEDYEKKYFYQWAIVLKENNDLIGSIGIVNLDEDIDMIEIGYCISKKYWKQGITSEALNELIAFFFDKVNANRIMAKHDINNPNSGKVMLKCGLQKEGILGAYSKNNTGISDIAVYAIIKKDYNKL